MTSKRLKQLRLIRELIHSVFGGEEKISATGRAMDELLDEVERLRKVMALAAAHLRYVHIDKMSRAEVADMLEKEIADDAE